MVGLLYGASIYCYNFSVVFPIAVNTSSSSFVYVRTIVIVGDEDH